jgi:hypothetical protein
LPTLVEDLLDIVGRSYDGIDYVVLHDIHETMLDPLLSVKRLNAPAPYGVRQPPQPFAADAPSPHSANRPRSSDHRFPLPA